MPRRTGHKQVRRLAEVEHEDFIRYRASHGDRQVVFALLELPRGDDRLHRNHLRLPIGHFDSDGSLPRHRRDDSDLQGREAQGYIILQRLDFGDPDTCGGDYLVQGNRRPDRRLDGRDADAEILQRLFD